MVNARVYGTAGYNTFSDEDILYVLGDVVDGKEPVKTLLKMMGCQMLHCSEQP